MALENNLKSVVHFMLYPGPHQGRSTQLGESPEEYMLETIQKIVDDKYFKGIEITLIKDPAIRKKVASLLKSAKMYVTFCAQPIQLINEDKLIADTDISSIDELERQNAVKRIMECIDQAVELGAKQICMVSGQDPGTESGLTTRRQATRQLIRSLNEICRYAKQKSSKMLVTLEMFDREIGEGLKGQLVGPTNEAVLVAEEVKLDNKHENFGLLYDISHMFFLKNGFETETPDVLRQLAPYLNWIHIANSIAEKGVEGYGDYHVGMDDPHGAVSPQILEHFVRVMNEIQFDGGIGFEFMPGPRQVPESVINIAKSMFEEACNQIPVNYAIGGYRFKTRSFLPENIFFKITDVRTSNPDIITEVLKNRKRRIKLAPDGKLVIIAADHPGRNVTTVGDNPYRMGDRQEYLGRLIRSLLAPGVDGVMATPDIMDELFIVEHMLKTSGHEGILDNKVLIGCTNRGGLSGSAYEMDDRITAYQVADIKKLGLDGAKMMFRLDLTSNQARYSQYTVERVAGMIRQCNEFDIPAFVEPLRVEQTRDGYEIVRDTNEIIKTIGVATALGGSSKNLWLKIPYVENFELVARATSAPILLLGGPSVGDPTGTIESFVKGMGAGANVRGAMVGRNLLYPGYDDPLAVSAAVGKVVHDAATALDAVKKCADLRGKDVELLMKILSKAKTEPA